MLWLIHSIDLHLSKVPLYHSSSMGLSIETCFKTKSGPINLTKTVTCYLFHTLLSKTTSSVCASFDIPFHTMIELLLKLSLGVMLHCACRSFHFPHLFMSIRRSKRESELIREQLFVLLVPSSLPMVQITCDLFWSTLSSSLSAG